MRQVKKQGEDKEEREGEREDERVGQCRWFLTFGLLNEGIWDGGRKQREREKEN